MRVFVVNIVVAVVLVLLGTLSVSGAGMTLIKVSDSEITVQLDASVSGSVKLLEIEPYDTLNPLRGLVQNRPDCQQLDLTNDGFLRMTFLNGSPFDPQILFSDTLINADYVGQFSMRVRVSGTQGGVNMPFRIFALPTHQDISVPADGEWHIVRADMTTGDWSGMRTLRIDPANAEAYSINSNAVVDIDWAAVTYRDDFSGDRNHTGLDVFIDLGMPEPSWTGTAQSEVVLPRHDGLRDRLYSKYILTDGGTNQIGNARYVTDLSGLSYREDSFQNWSALNTNNGVTAAVASNGILSVQYQLPGGTWDPGVQESGARRVDMDVAQEFAMKYRISGYSGGLSAVPMSVFGFVSGEVGNARQDDVLIPDGEWHVFRATLNNSVSSLTWHGDVRVRMDVPNANTAGSQASDFAGGTFELDWVAVSDDALFTPSRPICNGGRVWTFEADRTAPLQSQTSFKGLSGPVFDDFIDLGIDVYKMNFLQRNAMDTGLSPAVTWPVDEFNVGINKTYMNNTMIPAVVNASTNGMAVINTFLNKLEDYWIDEGTANQRFNPLRNYLTSSNAPNNFSVAHNVMDPVGLAYYRGALEYLGQTFSDPTGDNGQIFRFTIGNEVDAHWSWYNVGELELGKVVEIYLTSCRMADLALRSRNPNFRVYLSFTHHWNGMAGGGSLRAGKPREFLELFAAKAKAEGDFPWALCIHPYPVNLFDPTFWDDSEPTDSFNTPYITFKNLQTIRRYLQRDAMLYHGQPRPINLGEQGFHVTTDGDPTAEALQAAALAYSFKIAEQVPGIEAYLYHRQLDHSLEGNLRFGLGVDADGAAPWAYDRKRPSWDVMQAYGTTNEATVFDPYLTNLPIVAWSDINLADIELRYEFNEPNPDITTTKLPVFDITNGVFSGTVATNDPQIINQNVNTYGDGQETLLMRLKTVHGGNWQLFWKRAGDAGFAPARSILIPVSASTGFQIVSADLSGDEYWDGQNITAWRLDPVGIAAGDYDFELDYLLFGPAGDFDGDGISDSEESSADSDGDGLPDFADTDSNGNGWSDAREVSNGWNPASVDTDGDGIDNEWEIRYGYDPFDNLEAGWDADGDGFDTLAEHIALTDPTNGLSYFVISGQANGTNIFVDGKAGRTYTLLRTGNLVSNDWNAVDTVYTPIEQPIVLVDTNEDSAGAYEVEVGK